MNLNSRIPKEFCCLVIASAPLLMIFSRNISTPILVFSSIVFLFLGFQSSGLKLVFREILALLRKPGVVLVLVSSVFVLCSVVWSPAKDRGLASSMHLFGNLFLVLVSFAVVSLPPKPSIKVKTLAMLAVAALVFAFEIANGLLLREFFGGAQDVFRLNRSVVAIVLFMPIAAVAFGNEKSKSTVSLLIAFVAGSVAFYSESETAQLAFVVTCIVYVLSVFLPGLMLLVIPTSIIASIFLFPLVSPYINSLIPEAVHNVVKYSTMGVRADMWAAYASLFGNSFWIGHGVEASYVAGETYKYLGLPGELLGQAHPHNLVIQIWYELGLVGALLLAGVILCFARSLKWIPNQFSPSILATTAAVWTVAVVSHGAWQAWWWSLVGLVAIAWVIVIGSEHKDTETGKLLE